MANLTLNSQLKISFDLAVAVGCDADVIASVFDLSSIYRQRG